MSRVEKDSLGEMVILNDVLWGIQTKRAIDNFHITGRAISDFPAFIQALAYTKRAACHANKTLGLIKPEIHDAIVAACDEVIAGKHADAFPLDPIQGGAGTSCNMNMNEVLANLALEKLGHKRGDYEIVNPNDHVNRSQSTNDVYATAVRISVILASVELERSMLRLADAFDERAVAFKDVLKLGRTQMQDAVPMSLGQEFGAFATTIREDISKLTDAAALFNEVNLGGTAIGTRINAPKEYGPIAVRELGRLVNRPVVQAANLIEATWDMGAFVMYSSVLKRIATKLSKIANDLRLLSSGPRGGFGEIHLPDKQPGSSIMPGKVNPVIPEVVNQVCFQVIGNDLAITLAAEAGQLQLNAMEPLIAFNVHISIRLMVNAIATFIDNCVIGIEANEVNCRRHLDFSVGLSTALVPYVGYAKSAEIAKLALKKGKTVLEIALEETSLKESELKTILDPARLINPD